MRLVCRVVLKGVFWVLEALLQEPPVPPDPPIPKKLLKNKGFRPIWESGMRSMVRGYLGVLD